MNPLQFLRLAHWARQPPSKRTIAVIFGAVTVCALLWGIEAIWGWPDWLTTNGSGRRGPMVRP
ncbi:hypothetical protein ACXN5S_05040 [Pseudoroseicyclus sp. H15]